LKKPTEVWKRRRFIETAGRSESSQGKKPMIYKKIKDVLRT